MDKECTDSSRRLFCKVSPDDIRAFVSRNADKSLVLLSDEDLELFTQIMDCSWSTEIYYEAKAEMLGKRLVLVSNGVPIQPPPEE